MEGLKLIGQGLDMALEELKELKAQIKDLEEYKAKCSQLEQENDKLVKGIDKAYEELKQERNKYHDLWVKCSKEQDKRIELDEEYLKLKKEHLDLQEEHKKLKANIVLTRDKINRDGRPKALTEEEVQLAKEQYMAGSSYRKIAEEMGVGHSTIARAVKEPSAKQSSAFGQNN